MEILAFSLFLVRSSLDLVLETIRFDFGGANLTAGAIVNVIILSVTGLLTLQRPRNMLAISLWAPFLAIAAVSVSWAPDTIAAIRMLIVLTASAAAFALPFALSDEARHNTWLFKATVLSSGVPVIAGILEYVFWLDTSGRVKSTFAHPNVFAFYLTTVVGMIFFLLTSSVVKFTPLAKRFIFPYLSVLLGLIVMTQTRAAWAGVLIIFIAFATLIDRRYLFALTLLPTLMFIPAVSERLSDLGRGTEYTGQMKSEDDALNSFAWRTVMWQSAIDDASNTPFFGKGLASFGPNALRFFPLAENNRIFARGVGAHNAFIQAGYEVGLFGLLAYLAIFAGLLFKALNHYRIDRNGVVICVAMIASYMAANFSDNMFDYGVVNIYFWGTMGTMFAKWENITVRYRSRDLHLELAGAR